MLIKFFKGIPVGSCPKSNCKSTNIYRRIKEIKPSYRCGKCGNEFDYPQLKWIFPTNEECYKKTKYDCNSRS
jgi:DNA-directed RNA polymerase subunit RPC12/RpoP